MRRSEGETGSIGVCYVFAAAGSRQQRKFGESRPA
jgi:hypothetical protein